MAPDIDGRADELAEYLRGQAAIGDFVHDRELLTEAADLLMEQATQLAKPAPAPAAPQSVAAPVAKPAAVEQKPVAETAEKPVV